MQLAREEDDARNNNNIINNIINATDNGAVVAANKLSNGSGTCDEDDDDNGNDSRRPSVALLRQRFDVAASSPAPSPAPAAASGSPAGSPAPADGKHQRPEDGRDREKVREDAASAPLAGGHEDNSRHQRLNNSPGPAPSSDSVSVCRVASRRALAQSALQRREAQTATNRSTMAAGPCSRMDWLTLLSAVDL